MPHPSQPVSQNWILLNAGIKRKWPWSTQPGKLAFRVRSSAPTLADQSWITYNMQMLQANEQEQHGCNPYTCCAANNQFALLRVKGFRSLCATLADAADLGATSDAALDRLYVRSK